jgi:hypothetical protein
MIQVNLLPGSASKSQGRDFNLSGLVSGAASSISDKYLVSAVGVVSATVLAVGFLFMGQSSRERTLMEREQRGVQDSARYRVVLEAKAKAEATRDSLYQQVAIIKSIDDSRYLWPHLLEEISNELGCAGYNASCRCKGCGWKAKGVDCGREKGARGFGSR